MTVSEKEILRLRFCCVSIPRRKGTPAAFLRRRCELAARRLHKAGVTRAVFPEDFPSLEVFARWEIRPAEPLALYRTLAAELVQARLTACGWTGKNVSVAVCARRITEEVRRTVTDLCVRNRYVMLASPERDDAFCRRLRREYGVPLIQTADTEQLGKAAVMVRFSPETECRPEQEVIDLFPGGTPVPERLSLLPELEERIPVGCDRDQLLAALYRAGTVRLGQIQVIACSSGEAGASDGKKA